MKPNEASHLVIGAAIKVHTALGAGVLESAYDACMFYELTAAHLHFEHQVHLPIVYERICLSAAYRIDFIIETVSWLKSNALREYWPFIERRS